MASPDIDDPELPLLVLFDRWPETAGLFLSRRMLGSGCPVAPFHTVTDACLEYGLDAAGFRCDLQTALTTTLSP